jgi:hypothetical protein
MNKREITKKNLQQGVLKRLVEDCSNPLKYLLKRMKEKKFLGLLSKDASSSHTLNEKREIRHQNLLLYTNYNTRIKQREL